MALTLVHSKDYNVQALSIKDERLLPLPPVDIGCSSALNGEAVPKYTCNIYADESGAFVAEVRPPLLERLFSPAWLCGYRYLGIWLALDTLEHCTRFSTVAQANAAFNQWCRRRSQRRVNDGR
jgi:hypothetical protein